jgi:tRNA pseudouridine38-40 synthase
VRLKVVISYDGASFYGMQKQSSKPSVQSELERSLKKIGIFEPNIIASGRTDRFVHANNQVISIDVASYWSDTKKLLHFLSRHLPNGIAINSISKVTNEFHPRYSAKRRVYRYIISAKKPSVFCANYVAYIPEIDYGKIQADIKLFIGSYDFEFFRKSGSSPKTTKRTIFDAYVYRYRDCIVVRFEADGFLRSQVRMMIYALINSSADEIKEQLLRQKQHSNRLVPPYGLYLARVKY